MRQRLVIAGAIAVGTIGLLAVVDRLRPTDGSSGLSLMSARVGPVAATAMLALAALPALILGLIAAMGNPLSGVFAITVSLTVLAGVGGSIRGWLWRSSLPGAYTDLIIETVIWQAGVMVMLIVIQYLRSPMRTRWPALAFSDHLGVDTHLRFPQLQSLGAGAVSAAVGGAAAWVLLRSDDTGQVIGALIAAFFIGGLFGHLVFPNSNPVGILYSPAVVAIISYAYVTTQYSSQDRLLEAWHNHRLLPTALALPIYYASAGIAGCTIGIGFAQSLVSGERKSQRAAVGAS